MPKLSWTIGIKPFSGPTVYYTDSVLSLSYMTGRKSYLDQFTGSSLRVTLKNQTNVAANFTFGSIVTLNDDRWFIVTGVELDDYPGNTGLSTCTVTAVDYLQATGRTYITSEALIAMSALAQLYGLSTTTTTTVVNYTGGASLADAYTYTGTFLQRLQQTMNLEGSGALQLNDNKVIIAGRNVDPGVYFRSTFTRDSASGSNISYADIRRIRADQNFANRITVTSDTDPDETASNNSSVTQYGVFADGVSIVDTDATGRTGLAQWLANSRSDPAMEYFEVDVVDTSQVSGGLTAIQNIWGDDTAQAKIHDLVYRVPGAGSDTTAVVYLEGTRINVTPTQTRLTYYFSPLTLYRFFLLDNSTLGILDSSRLGW